MAAFCGRFSNNPIFFILRHTGRFIPPEFPLPNLLRENHREEMKYRDYLNYQNKRIMNTAVIIAIMVVASLVAFIGIHKG